MQDFKSKNGFIIFWIVAIALLFGAIVIVTPFIPAILWATVFSILLYPVFQKLLNKGWNRGFAAFVVTMVPAFVVTIPLAVMGTIAGVQVVSYAQELLQHQGSTTTTQSSVLRTIGEELDKTAKPLLEKVGAPEVKLADLLDKNKADIAQRLSEPLSNGFKSFMFTIVTLIMSLLTMFFMVRDCHNMKDAALELVPLPRKQSEQILSQIANTVRSVFFAVVIVAGIQGTIARIIYRIVGVPGAIPLALITTLLCTIPMLGAPVIYVPIGLSLLIQGKIWQGSLVLGVGFLVISQIDNLLRPLFIGKRTNLHEIPVFFSLLGGVLALGPIGLMAGPMLLTLILAFVDILRLGKESSGEIEEDSIPAAT